MTITGLILSLVGSLLLLIDIYIDIYLDYIGRKIAYKLMKQSVSWNTVYDNIGDKLLRFMQGSSPSQSDIKVHLDLRKKQIAVASLTSLVFGTIFQIIGFVYKI